MIILVYNIQLISENHETAMMNMKFETECIDSCCLTASSPLTHPILCIGFTALRKLWQLEATALFNKQDYLADLGYSD